MRVEGCTTTIFTTDRRQRFQERRADNGADRRRKDRNERRARHTAHRWFEPAFGAHILGQMMPDMVTPEEAARAYQQPEARTPLRPSIVAAKA